MFAYPIARSIARPIARPITGYEDRPPRVLTLGGYALTLDGKTLTLR